MNVAFPFQFDQRGHTATVDNAAHVREMIEQFLFTVHGERVNRPDFGSGLLQLVHAPNGPELAAAVQFSIQAGLQRYLGDLIDVQQLEVTADQAMLNIVIRYALKSETAANESTRITAAQFSISV